MSFFKVPSFLRSRSMDPQDAEVQAAMNAGQSRALQMVPEFEDDDDFLVDRSQADEQSSSQNSPVPQQPRQAQQLRQSQRLPAQQPPPPPAGNEFPFPERYESGQAEDSYANRNYYEYSQSQNGGPPPYPPQQQQQQQQQQQYFDYGQPQQTFPNPYNPPYQEVDPIRQLMAEGYSYEEAQRVLRYRQRNTATHSSMSISNYDLNSVNWNENSSMGQLPPQYQQSSARYPQPAPQYFSSSRSNMSMYMMAPPPSPAPMYPAPEPVPPRDEQLDIAIRRSIEDENRRRTMLMTHFTDHERFEREEIERANEHALQVALQSSFEALDEERRVRATANPWVVEQMNERALREALLVSMQEVRAPSRPIVPASYFQNSNAPVTKKILRKPSTDEMVMRDRDPAIDKAHLSYGSHSSGGSGAGGGRAEGIAVPHYHQLTPNSYDDRDAPASQPASRPPSLPRPAEEARPGSYVVSYQGGSQQVVQTAKEQALSTSQASGSRPPSMQLPAQTFAGVEQQQAQYQVQHQAQCPTQYPSNHEQQYQHQDYQANNPAGNYGYANTPAVVALLASSYSDDDHMSYYSSSSISNASQQYQQPQQYQHQNQHHQQLPQYQQYQHQQQQQQQQHQYQHQAHQDQQYHKQYGYPA